MSDTDLIQKWLDCLNLHSGRLRTRSFDLDAFRAEAVPVVAELKELRDDDGRIAMPSEFSQPWVDANTEFAAAATACMDVLAMVAYAEFIEELTGKKILPEPGETPGPDDPPNVN